MKLFKRLSVIALALAMVLSSTVIGVNAKTVSRLVLSEGREFELPVISDIFGDYIIDNPDVIKVEYGIVYALKEGTAILSYTGWNDEEYEYAVTVNPAPKSVKLNYNKKTVYTGKKFKLKYTVTGGSGEYVSISSSNPEIAYLIDDTVHAQKAGKATITVTTYNGVKAKCKVTVKQSITGIRMSRQRIAIPKNTKFKIKAKIDKGAKSKYYKWSSSNKKVATVKGKGKTAVITSKKAGKAKITVKVSNGKKQSCTVRVTKTKTSDSIKKQINSQPLYKEKTGFEALDKLVRKIFKKIFKKGYSTYDKIKAIYDYEIKNFVYGSKPMTNKQLKKYYKSKRRYYAAFYDEDIIHCAYKTLVTKRGVCSDYAAVFTVMTRALGLDTYCVSGSTTKAGGGWTGHTWNNMIVNGKYVVFDAQVEDDISGGGAIYYYRFAKPDGEMRRYYKESNREGDITSFNHFKDTYELKTVWKTNYFWSF